MKRIDAKDFPSAPLEVLERQELRDFRPLGAGMPAESDAEKRARSRDERIANFAQSVPKMLRWATCESRAFGTELARTASQALHVLAARDAVARIDLACKTLLLAGPAGSGKSVLAVARARQVVDAGESAMFIDALDLATTYRYAGFQRCGRLEKAKAFPGVVILDDLGQDLAVPGSRAAIIELVRVRHNTGAKMIVTTGFAKPDLRREYDDAHVRRLTEPPRAVVLKLGAADEASR